VRRNTVFVLQLDEVTAYLIAGQETHGVRFFYNDAELEKNQRIMTYRT
jgi:hypothetical protein